MRVKLLVFIFLIVCLKCNAQNNCNCTISNDSENSQQLIQSKILACKAKGFELIASGFLDQYKFDSVEFYLKKSEKYYNATNCKSSEILTINKIWSKYYFIKAEYQTALDYSFKVLSISEETDNIVEHANVLLSISQIFGRMGQAEKGVSYCRMSIPLLNKLKESPEKVDILNKIGARFYFYFQDYKDKSYFDTAKIFYQQAISIAKRINYRKGKISSYNKMNTLSYRENDYKQALLYIDSAIHLSIPDKDINELGVSYGDKGNIYLKMGNYNTAGKYADSSLYYCLQTKFSPIIANAYSLIAEIADSAGNYQIAYKGLLHEKNITDSLNKLDKVKAVNELEKKYNQEKNEKRIKELKLQKLIYLLFAIAGFLAACLIAFYLIQQSLKHKHVILETEQRLNRARMNPHFFFNALTALQHLAIKEDNGKAVASNLSKFSYIMRETLESTYKDYISIKQEIDFLNKYLEIQKMRFPERFSFSLNVDDELEPADIMIPSMIIQPFIENSIEHGFNGINYAGEITVDFKLKNKEILVALKMIFNFGLETSQLGNFENEMMILFR